MGTVTDVDGDYKAWTRLIESNYATVNHYGDFQSSGFSIRCLKD
jgi:hypothetical protein